VPSMTPVDVCVSTVTGKAAAAGDAEGDGATAALLFVGAGVGVVDGDGDGWPLKTTRNLKGTRPESTALMHSENTL
jgi:hypothetical protein